MVAMIAGTQSPALAGSDNSSNTYAGDVNGIALPPGTFLAIEYLGYRNANNFVDPEGTKEDGKFSIFTSITRFVYFTQLFDHPLVLEFAGTFGNVTKAEIENERLSVQDGFFDPVFFITYGLINQPKNERFLAFTNYFYVPWGANYDKFKQVNVATADQTTWVPQIAYAEGLGKFGMPNLWFDLIVNASIHSDGDAPFAVAPGVQFDKLEQDNSYDVKAFLRYTLAPATSVAIGIEKSWGGEQVASGGALGALLGPTALGKDDFLKGHMQIAFPITADFHVDTDFTHDFQREGGFKEDFTAEIRLTKLFIPKKPVEEPLK